MPSRIEVKRIGYGVGMCQYELIFDDVKIELDMEEMRELYKQMKEEFSDET